MTTSAPLDRLLAGFAAGAPALAVSGLALDSRRVAAGDAFLAVRGHRDHGLVHAAKAVERGAAAVLWEPAPGVAAPALGVPSIAVDRLSWHVGAIAARFFGDPTRRMFVAGITGTDGKTSTAWLVAQAFERLGRPCAYVGTLGLGRPDHIDAGTHTTPDPVTLQAWLAGQVAGGVDACAMEVSSHALDQNRVGGVRFGAAVLTNVTRDHLDYHGTVEAYAQAKRRLFDAGDGRALIFNRDDARGEAWAAEAHQAATPRVIRYGLDGAAPAQGRYLLGRALRLSPHGIAFDIDSSFGSAHIASRLLGRFNAFNLLAALGVLLEAGVPLADAAAALGEARTVPGRIEGFSGPQAAPLVVVDYAHTPQALEQVLAAVRAHTRGRLWCVFGCGGDRDRGKRPLMGEAASRLADEVIVTDDNPRSERPEAIVQEILGGVPQARRGTLRVEHDRAKAIRSAVGAAGGQDVVLVAGKGHETTQTYGADVRPFSDRALVAELVGAVH